MKERLDVLLVQRQMAASREKAKAIIMAGCVYVEGQREDKAGSMFQDSVSIEAVSYTHLDVYKRQMPMTPLSFWMT